MLTSEEAEAPEQRRVGPYIVGLEGDGDALVLRLENRGELTYKGLALLVFTMLIVSVLGVLGVLQMATAPAPNAAPDSPGRFFAPRQNHFGFLWLAATGLMLGLIPLYVARAYRAGLAFTFRRSDDAFLRDDRLVTRLRKIEHLAICETKDPDSRYLYVLDLVYGDGRTMFLHNGYDEREVMNLANEIAGFVGTTVVWR